MLENMIADIESNKKISSVVTEFFLRGRMFNILLVFMLQSYFKSYLCYKMITFQNVSCEAQVKNFLFCKFFYF